MEIVTEKYLDTTTSKNKGKWGLLGRTFLIIFSFLGHFYLKVPNSTIIITTRTIKTSMPSKMREMVSSWDQKEKLSLN